ncbi:hypothetical protein FY534_06620 [Alicyclobacillus sp. TC]|uniref:Membrane protein YkvI n=1 Tax=Alicyclobacillus tolerans TaxID=90970 RepID=A0ABT9LV78_9BACL|nr:MULTISPECIES: hypothetical protein [Alicyclobacillus]MDP9728149.1 putative membrane protein YkvI [Alicyclobacillus tengchongensis]QRF23374.1 hypothetical protein FY534_06620 [Alicyclobacillus sp. TC]
MQDGSIWRSVQIACVYIGTVVGAGFASGREVDQFFVRFGIPAFSMVLLTTLLFIFFGYRMLRLGRILRAHTFRDATKVMFGKRGAWLIDILYVMMMFGLTVAMLAGAGELFRERLHAPYFLGVFLTALLSWFTVRHGIHGLMRANVIIVPLMVSFVIYVGWQTFLQHKWPVHSQWIISNTNPGFLHAVLSVLFYIGLNVGLSAGVLIPLGATAHHQKELKLGSLLGSLALGMMLLTVTFILLCYGQEARNYALPMAYVAAHAGAWLEWIFPLVLWAEIFSTIVSNVYALAFLSPDQGKQRRWLLPLILFLAGLLSAVGFKSIVQYGYTAFGCLSLLFLVALLRTYHAPFHREQI